MFSPNALLGPDTVQQRRPDGAFAGNFRPGRVWKVAGVSGQQLSGSGFVGVWFKVVVGTRDGSFGCPWWLAHYGPRRPKSRRGGHVPLGSPWL